MITPVEKNIIFHWINKLKGGNYSEKTSDVSLDRPFKMVVDKTEEKEVIPLLYTANTAQTGQTNLVNFNNKPYIGKKVTKITFMCTPVKGTVTVFKCKNPNSLTPTILEEIIHTITVETELQTVTLNWEIKEGEYIGIGKVGDVGKVIFGAETDPAHQGVYFTENGAAKSYATNRVSMGVYVEEVSYKIEFEPKKKIYRAQINAYAPQYETKYFTLPASKNIYAESGYYAQLWGHTLKRVCLVTHTTGTVDIVLLRDGKKYKTNTITLVGKTGDFNWYEVDFGEKIQTGDIVGVLSVTGVFAYMQTFQPTKEVRIAGCGFQTINPSTYAITGGGGFGSLGFGFDIEVEIEEAINTPYTGKTFSVQGDSISTFPVWSVYGNSIYHMRTVDIVKATKITEVNQLWWHRVMSELGAIPQTIDTFSGSYMAGTIASALNLGRYARVDGNTDYHLVFIGINDFSGGIAKGVLKNKGLDPLVATNYDPMTLLGGYQAFIEKFQKTHPKTQLILISTLPRFLNGQIEGGKQGSAIENMPLTEFGYEAIKSVADLYGLPFISFFDDITVENASQVWSASDRTHPMAEGHQKMAEIVVRELLKLA